MKKLLLDFNNLSIRTLLSNHEIDWSSGDYSFHRHLVLNTIFSNIKKFKPDEVILAIDDIRNWRKKAYPEYKANRKLIRDASDFDWASYFTYIEEYIEELKILPFKIMRVPYAEADDIIGVLSKYFLTDENIIVTSDKDYIQLLQYKQNKIYDPIKKDFVKESNPYHSLQVKIIMGDKGDNVPAIKDRVGEKTAMKILAENTLTELLMDDTIKSNYQRNELLISFDRIPAPLQKEIIRQYDLTEINENPVDYYAWMVRHKLRQLSDKASLYIPILNNLKIKGTSKEDLSVIF